MFVRRRTSSIAFIWSVIFTTVKCGKNRSSEAKKACENAHKNKGMGTQLAEKNCREEREDAIDSMTAIVAAEAPQEPLRPATKGSRASGYDEVEQPEAKKRKESVEANGVDGGATHKLQKF